MKSVSVVVPCFNAGQHLNDAVQSALAQTWPDLEVVIVDDGSSDDTTLRLLEETHWPRTRIFHQSSNAGPSAARNRAIREARGEYILPLDADDTIEPTYVEKAVAVMNKHPEVGCVYCKAMKFGAEQGPWELPPYQLEELVIDNVIFVTALFRKADWQAIGGFDERLRHGVEDYDFWVKMVSSGKGVVQLDEFLFNYRVQEKSRTTRFQDGLDAKVTTYAEIFRNNSDFYTAHADVLFKHRFGLYAQIEEWRQRCASLEARANAKGGQQRDGGGDNSWNAEARIQELTARSNELEAMLASHGAYWQRRYGKLDDCLNRHPLLRKAARLARNVFQPSLHNPLTKTQEGSK